MRSLKQVTPTPEQKKLIVAPEPGTRIIRGAAGSGKTTTALLMLRMALGYLLSDKKRTGNPKPIRAVVFTYNRTLSAYIKDVATHALNQSNATKNEVSLAVTTLAKYAKSKTKNHQTISESPLKDFIRTKAAKVGLNPDFLVDEVDYIAGRFPPSKLQDYLVTERTGRGTVPRVDKRLRADILDKVIYPLAEYKKQNQLSDWNDLALDLTEYQEEPIDIVIADEAQDFSANQLRAIVSQLAPRAYATFVLDTAQRIYTRGFTWKEVGLEVRPENTHRLKKNYRNTTEIATFASELLDEKKLDDDATLPLFSSSELGNRMPVMYEGRYSQQVAYALKFICEEVDLDKETVAFLHPKGWKCFAHLAEQLTNHKLKHVDISRLGYWPDGEEQIALSTIHSAKGLEFDHVFLLGLSEDCFNCGDEEDDDNYLRIRRLIAMAITRARKSVTLGYNLKTKPKFMELFSANTYELKSA